MPQDPENPSPAIGGRKHLLTTNTSGTLAIDADEPGVKQDFYHQYGFPANENVNIRKRRASPVGIGSVVPVAKFGEK